MAPASEKEYRPSEDDDDEDEEEGKRAWKKSRKERKKRKATEAKEKKRTKKRKYKRIVASRTEDDTDEEVRSTVNDEDIPSAPVRQQVEVDESIAS